MKEIYKNALSEVNAIINNSDEYIINKIPNRFKNYITQNMNKSYEVNIQPEKKILEQDITNEAKSIIALLYRDYLCSNTRRKQLIQEEIVFKAREEEIKRKKYEIKWKN